MGADSRTPGHPLLAAVLTASLVGADPAVVASASPAPTTESARLEDVAISEEAKQALELIEEEESLDQSSPMLERPHHQVNFLARYMKPLGFNGFIQASYISSSWDSKALFADPFPARFDHNDVTRVGGFFLLNTKLSYEIWKGVKPFLFVENLLDADYQRIRGFPGPGRSFFFGVNAVF